MDNDVRIGGKPVLTVAGQGEPDLLAALSGDALTAAAAAMGASTTVASRIGPVGRTDQLVQRLTREVPAGVADLGLPAEFLTEQFSTPLGDADVDVVILSAASDVQATHRVGPDGAIVRPPADYTTVWPTEAAAALDRAFHEVPLLTGEEYVNATREAIAAIKERSGAHVLLLGVSTLGGPRHISYAGIEDDHRLRAHRINAAQIRLSMELGVSVIDVDRVVANYGGAGQVPEPFAYSEPLVRAICDEIAFVLGDIGFFENRPLVAQVGRGR